MSRVDSAAERDGSASDVDVSSAGLDLFWQETSTRRRYRYLLHFGVYVGLLLTTIWPVFTVFNRVEPYVLGLPFNMFWVTVVLVLVTVNSLLLYRFDEGGLTGET
jgi:hypothetical protein